jgi:hypothetical protein
MCRNIRTLFNYDPSATDLEIYEASLQYVRKVSGYRSPSVANEAAFKAAVDDVARATSTLIDSLVTHAPPKNREQETAKAKARAAARFSP